MILNLVKVFASLTAAFFIGIALTPLVAHYLYKHKLWKKTAGKIGLDGKEAVVFNSLHKEREVGTPRMGGIIIWLSVLFTVMLFWLLAIFWPSELFQKLNFLSRSQTWIPFAALIAASLVGLADDWLIISGKEKNGNGLPFRRRLLIVIIIGLLIAYWFFFKLGMTSVFVPFLGAVEIGVLFIPFFLLVLTSLFSSGVIDGLDGLAGGLMAIIFAAYSALAFFQNQIDLAAFCAVIAGGILAFLWFNIPPARFYMSETGILGLTTALTTIVFLTDSVLLLPVIALPLVATSLSVVIQLASKKWRQGKKVFLAAPLHHHFEALGWPAHKVVMRYWVIGTVAAIIGLILALVSR